MDKKFKRKIQKAVKESGGLESFQLADAALWEVKRRAQAKGDSSEYVDFFLKLAARPDRAAEIVAVALLGTTVAILAAE